MDLFDCRLSRVVLRMSLASNQDLGGMVSGDCLQVLDVTEQKTRSLIGDHPPSEADGRKVGIQAHVGECGSKISKSIADTTASVAIVSEEDIEFQQLNQFRDAFRTVGNVLDADWVDAGFVIRGVNSRGLAPGGAPLASLYIDGIEQTVNGTRWGARGLWDVEA